MLRSDRSLFFNSLYGFPRPPSQRTPSLYAFSSHYTAKQMVHFGAEFSLCVISYESSYGVSRSGCPRPRVQGKGIHIFDAC